MTSIVELHLSFNNLTSIPASIGSLHNLQFLALDHNQIQSIPSSVSRQSRPNEIFDHRHRLFSSQIGSCTSLSVFSLRSNCLTQLPDEIGRLSMLKVLNVSGKAANERTNEQESITSSLPSAHRELSAVSSLCVAQTEESAGTVDE